MTDSEILEQHEYDVHYYGGGRRQVLAAMNIFSKQECIALIKFLSRKEYDFSVGSGELSDDGAKQFYDEFISEKK